jgi:hypothetical protein
VTVAWGTAIAALFSVLYLSTLAPTVLYHDDPEMFDPVMLQAAAPVLGIAHPTGYPSYMMLAHLFTYLPLGDEAYRVNLVSAVFGVLAVVMTFLVAVRLTGRAAAAASGALAFGLTPIFWSQAVIAEVYTMNAVFIASVLYVLLLWRESRRDRHLLLAAFLMGLSLTHHLSSALLIPAALLFVYLTDRSLLKRGGLWLKGLGLFALGLLPYVYLPIRAAMDAPLNEADPSNIERFLLLVSGGGFLLKNLLDITGGSNSSAGSDSSQSSPITLTDLWPATKDVAFGIIERLSPAGEFVLGQFPVLILACGVLGIVRLTATDKAVTALLGTLFSGWMLHALTYGVSDYYVFFIPAYLIFGLFVARGVGVLLSGTETLARRLPAGLGPALVIGVCALVLISPLSRAVETYAREDRSEDYRGREILETVAAEADPGATILHHRSSLWYLVLVEKRRWDLTLVDPFETSWVRHTDLVWPEDLNAEESAARYGTDDLSGVEAARIAASRGPVYLLNQELGAAQNFREAGFRVEPVGNDAVMFELIPPNSQRPEQST